jgi:tetratricopeptide (TPR) repeat protein
MSTDEQQHAPHQVPGDGGSHVPVSGAAINNATATVADAAKLRDQGRLDEAEAMLRSVLALHPGNVDALVALGHVARRRGDRAASLAAFEAAAAAAPKHAGVKIEAAADLQALGRLDEAEFLCRQVLEGEPAHFGALVWLGHVARRRGDRAASLAAFQAAAAADPKHAGVKVDAAVDLHALGRLDEAELLCRQVLDGEPAHFEGLVWLGHILRRRSDRAGSLAAFEAASASKPDHVGALLEVVNGLRELARLDEAETKLQVLLTKEPGHVGALCGLGSLKLERFRLEEAELLFRQAADAVPSNPAGLLGLGNVARRRGDRAAAIAYFEAAHAADRSHAGAAIEVAGELREQGHHEKARQVIDALAGQGFDAYQTCMQNGHLYRKEGNHQKALESFRAAHDQQPTQAAPFFEMVAELHALGRPAEAYRLLLQGLRVAPGNIGLLMQSAEHHWFVEDFESSLAVCHDAIESQPHNLHPYLHGSRAATELGNKDEARKLLDDAERHAGSHPEIIAAKANLLMRDCNWAAVEALLSAPGLDAKRYACLWTLRAQLATKTGSLAAAEAAIPDSLPSLQEASLARHFRGQIVEARWRLDDAARHYRQAIALNRNNAGAHFDLARTALKQLDLEACRRHLRRMMDLTSSSIQLRGQSLNLSQSHIGQLIDEFVLDPALLKELQRVRALPLRQQREPLRELVAENPDHTPSAIMLLIAMRQAGEFDQAPHPASPPAVHAIPRRIFQFWDDPEPPQEILELMDTWRGVHATFQYVRLDDKAAQNFLRRHGLIDVLRAYRQAREPAQKADVLRLACLATEGGFYADADDRSLSHLFSWVPPEATFVASQEDYGTLGNNFIGATTGHPVIQLALRLATDALNRGDADFLWLSTGPGLLTRAFAQIIAQGEQASKVASRATIFELGTIQRHIGIHCPVCYKRSDKHWGRSSFASVTTR